MLFIVGTPIGHLDDISIRALDVLRSVDIILAEDTRVTGLLKKKYEIDTPLRSYHAHNEHKIVEQVTDVLAAGQKAALVSDAGMPGISDPGYLLVSACIAKEIPIEIISGPVALIHALIGSGLPTHDFFFAGFLPQKKGRQKRWDTLVEMSTTIICYESTHRIEKILQEINERLPEKQVVIAKELTKIHENFLRGTAVEILALFKEKPSLKKGEFVVLINNRD